MARLTKAQQILIGLQAVLVFIVVSVITNIIVQDQLGIYPQSDPPDYESPWMCSEIKHKQCTTREGKCTLDKKQCVYPESRKDCEYFILTDKLSKFQWSRLKSRYQNVTVRVQKRKVFEQYCGNMYIYKYKAVSEDLSTLLINFQLSLSFLLLAIFYTQVSQFAHKIVYDWLISI